MIILLLLTIKMPGPDQNQTESGSLENPSIDFNILLYFILDRDQHLVIFMLQIKRFPVQIPDLCDRRACRSDQPQASDPEPTTLAKIFR